MYRRARLRSNSKIKHFRMKVNIQNIAFRSTFAAATMGVAAVSANASTARDVRSESPNVVLILIDDLSYFGVGAYGLKSVSGANANFTNEARDSRDG